MPVVSVRETEAQTHFRLAITRIVGLCSWCSESTFTSLLFTEGKMLFFSPQNLEDTESCRQSSCYCDGVLFLLMCCLRHLPCWWPDSKFYVLEFPLSPGIGDRFQQAEHFWQPGLVPFISLLLGNWNLFILVQAEVQFAEGLWAVRTEVTFYSVKQLWYSVDYVSLGCSRRDSSNCSTCGSIGLENPNLWGSQGR